jgi:EipB-like
MTLPLTKRQLRPTLVFALMVLTCPIGEAANLAAHRAVYDLESDRLERSTGYSKIIGRLVYEITGSRCEGWTMNYRLANEYALQSGTAETTDTQVASWESGDGLEMQLVQKQFRNNSLLEQSKINVAKPTLDQEGKGRISTPNEREFSLSADVMFPVLYQARVLDAAARGETRDVSLVFDGSDGSNAYRVVDFIGKERGAGVLGADADNPAVVQLKTLKSWPMAVSYYRADLKADEQAVYQSSYVMFENGVSTDLNFDYGVYTLKAKLTQLELLPADPCP